MIPTLQTAGPLAAAPQSADPASPAGDGRFDAVFGNEGPQIMECRDDIAQETPIELDLPVGCQAILPAAPCELRGEGQNLEESCEQQEGFGRSCDLIGFVQMQAGAAPRSVSAEACMADAAGGVEQTKAPDRTRAEAATPEGAPVVVDAESAISVKVKEAAHPSAGVATARESAIFSALQAVDAPELDLAKAPLAEEPMQGQKLAGDLPAVSDWGDGGADPGSGLAHHGGSRTDRLPGAFPAVAPDRNEPVVLRHLTDALSQSQASNGAAEISLNATELGRLSMTVAQDGGLVSVTLAADRPETLDLLRRNIDLLARDLRDLGFDSLNFSFQQGAGGTASQRPAEAGAVLHEPGGLPDASSASPNQHLLSKIDRPVAQASGGLDLRL